METNIKLWKQANSRKLGQAMENSLTKSFLYKHNICVKNDKWMSFRTNGINRFSSLYSK